MKVCIGLDIGRSAVKVLAHCQAHPMVSALR